MDDLLDDPDYQKFLDDMSKFCHCEYDCPCDGVLAAGPCDMKKDDRDMDGYDSEIDL